MSEVVERVLPSNADFRRVLPLAVEAKSARRIFFPVNGQNFTSDGNNIIRIDVSADAFLDPKHSYLKFRFTNNSGAGVGFDYGGGHNFCRRLRIEQSGQILSDLNHYNRLLSAVILPAQGDVNSLAHRTITEGQRYTNDGAAGNSVQPTPAADISGASLTTPTNNNTLCGAGTTWDFCIPLMNGLLGTTQNKMIPLQLLGSAPITIEIELAPLLDIGTFTAQPAAGTNYTLSDVRYIAQLVEVPPDINNQLKLVQEVSGGKLAINGTDYTHFNGNVAAQQTGAVSINVPARRKSLKSLFFVGASQNYVAPARQDQVYNLSFGGHFNMNTYQMKVGSIMIPPTPIQCDFIAPLGPWSTRGETLMELKKCFGTLSSTKGCGSLGTTNYMINDCDIGGAPVPSNGGALDTSYTFSPFGIDLESFQRTAIESGVNTADRATPITLLLNIGAQNADAVNVDCYVSYDSMYYIDESGVIRVSV